MTLKDVEVEIQKTLDEIVCLAKEEKAYKTAFISSHKDMLDKKLEALRTLEDIMIEELRR